MPVRKRTWIGRGGHIESGNAGMSAGGNHQGGKDAKQGGFSAAVRTQEAKDLCWSNIEGQAVEREPGAVIMRQPVQLDGSLPSDPIPVALAGVAMAAWVCWIVAMVTPSWWR